MFPRKPFVRITVQAPAQSQAPVQAPEHNQPLPLPASIAQLQLQSLMNDRPFQLPPIEEIMQTTEACYKRSPIGPKKQRKQRRIAFRQQKVEPFSSKVNKFLGEKFNHKTDLGMAHIVAAQRFLRFNESFFKDFNFMAENNRLDEDPSLEQSLLRESRFALRSLDVKITIVNKPTRQQRKIITYGLDNPTLIPVLQKHYQISDEDINRIKEFIAPFKCFTFFINTQHDEAHHFIRIFRILTVKFLYDPKYVK